MANFRGYILFVVAVGVFFVELFYLIVMPLTSGNDFEVTTSQYWALAIPMTLIVGLISLTTMWIAYTMITTPQPVRLTYEEAYELAVEEESGSS